MQGPLILEQMPHSHLLVVVDPPLLSQHCFLLLAPLLLPPHYQRRPQYSVPFLQHTDALVPMVFGM